MRVLIGYPPIKARKKGATITLAQNRQYQEFANPTYFLPVVPASAATLLKERGYDVIWKDCIVENLDEKGFFEFLNEEKVDLFMFESKTPVIERHWSFINRLKEKFSDMKIVLVGDHVTYLPEESFKKSKVDFVLSGGYYDFLLLSLCEYLSKGKELDKGIWYRKNNKIVNTGKFGVDYNLDELPFIDRDLVNWKLYQREYNIKERPYAYIMSGRDCWYGKCKFCVWSSVLYPGFNVRSVGNVLDEVGMLIKKYRVRAIFDDCGTLNVGRWLRDLCNGLIDRGYNKKVSYSCNMRFGVLKEDDYKLMKEAGFRLLKFGLESANQKTLDRINKGIRVRDIVDGCRMAKKAGLVVHLTMIIGYPWENRKDALRTLGLAKYLMESGYADVLQSTILMPYPGTPLYEEGLRKKWFRINHEEYYRYDMSEPVFKTVDMDDKEVMRICNSIYKSTFLSPKYMLRHLSKIRNFEDLVYTLRGVKAVFGHIKDFSR